MEYFATLHRLQNEMLKYEMQKEGLEIEVKTILTDFELAIQMAAQSAFPWVELRGCRFHYAKVHIRADVMISLM